MTVADATPTVPAGHGLRRRAMDSVFHAQDAIVVRRWAFRGVIAVFVLAILASYAVPLWFQLRGDRLLVVTSGSMAPEIHAGDAVVVQQVTSASQLKVGQVVTFNPLRSTTLITHRIQALTMIVRRDPTSDTPVLDQTGQPYVDPYIRTKGDANESPDADLTPATQVRGIVREVHPGWGYLLGWAHSPMGRLLLFGPPLLMLVAAEVLSRIPARLRHRRVLWGSAPNDTEPLPEPSKDRDDEPALV
jgi:signal peptidase